MEDVTATVKTPNGKKRDDYKTAGAAARAAVARANAANVGNRERRVLLAVIIMLTTYSKVADSVSLAQVAVQAGYCKVDEPLGRNARYRVSKALDELQNAGVLTFERGGQGGWKSSRISLAAPKERRESGDARRESGDARRESGDARRESGDVGASSFDDVGASSFATNRRESGTPPRRSSEETRGGSFSEPDHDDSWGARLLAAPTVAARRELHRQIHEAGGEFMVSHRDASSAIPDLLGRDLYSSLLYYVEGPTKTIISWLESLPRHIWEPMEGLDSASLAALLRERAPFESTAAAMIVLEEWAASISGSLVAA